MTSTQLATRKLFIDGAWTEGATEETLAVINPATEETIAEVPQASPRTSMPRSARPDAPSTTAPGRG